MDNMSVILVKMNKKKWYQLIECASNKWIIKSNKWIIKFNKWIIYLFILN